MDSRQEKRSLFLLARSSGLSREDHGVSFYFRIFLSSLSLCLFLYLVFLFQLSLTPSISSFFRIHADLSMTGEIKIPKKDEREGGEKGIEGELLTTVGGQLANSRDACGNYIRSTHHPKKRRALWQKKNLPDDV